MKYIKTFSDKCEVSQVALGCMIIADKTDKEMELPHRKFTFTS